MKQHWIAITTVLACASAAGCPESRPAAASPASHPSSEDFAQRATSLARRHGEVAATAWSGQRPRMAVGESQRRPREYNASLENGRLDIVADAFAFALVATSCRPFSRDITICDDGVELSVSRGENVQALRPEAIYVNQAATLFMGGLDRRDRAKTQSIVVSDVNFDGHQDIALWTGTKGGYGSASYDIYLFDPSRNAFLRSPSFSALTEGRTSLFTIAGGKIHANSRSGCCIHEEETYAVVGNEPVLTERIVEDATGSGPVPKRSVSRRVNGKMREVEVDE